MESSAILRVDAGRQRAFSRLGQLVIAGDGGASEELVLAAAESGLSFQKYIQEVLESHAASRRLIKVDQHPGIVRVPGYEVGSENPDAFPFPAETYRVIPYVAENF